MHSSARLTGSFRHSEIRRFPIVFLLLLLYLKIKGKKLFIIRREKKEFDAFYLRKTRFQFIN